MADEASGARDADAAASDPAMVVEDRVERLSVRRSPKYSVFFVLGAALGVLVALILTFAFHGTDQTAASGVDYTPGQVFGFLALIGVAVGATLGGIVALLFDRVLGRRTHEVTVDRETVHYAE